MIGSHISGQISGCRRRQDHHGVDDQKTYPANGQHNDHRHQHHEEIIIKPDRNAFALCQGRIDADKMQTVKSKKPEQQRQHKDKQKTAEFPVGNA